jgi:hypothetical protein
MIPYPANYGTPPAWWGQGRDAAGKAAADAIRASEAARQAGTLKPVKAIVRDDLRGLFGEVEADEATG